MNPKGVSAPHDSPTGRLSQGTVARKRHIFDQAENATPASDGEQEKLGKAKGSERGLGVPEEAPAS